LEGLFANIFNLQGKFYTREGYMSKKRRESGAQNLGVNGVNSSSSAERFHGERENKETKNEFVI
jgi:hypothetical protein